MSSYSNPSFPVPALSNYFNLDLTGNIKEPNSFSTNPSLAINRTGLIKIFNVTVESFGVWTNPHLGSKPISYVPQDLTFSDLTASMLHFYPTEAPLGIPIWEDISGNILSCVDLQTLICFSRVSKCCYLATKNSVLDAVWINDFHKKFPTLEFIKDSPLSARKQTMIFYHSKHEASKPFKAKMQRNDKIYHQLKQKIKTAEKEFKDAGGNQKSAEVKQQMEQQSSNFLVYSINSEKASPAESPQNSKRNNRSLLKCAKVKEMEKQKIDETGKPMCIEDATTAHKALMDRQEAITVHKAMVNQLYGEDYNEKSASKGINSDQWKLDHAIKHSIPNWFNDQQRFQEVIRASSD